MVVVGTGGIGSRFLNSEWPIEEGLTAGTTKQVGKQDNLVPEEGTRMLSKDRKLIDGR
jgi:hypothetical protein